MLVDVYRVIVGFFCSPGYYHNGFVGTHALGAHDVTMNQRVVNKLSKERNIDGHKRSSIYTIYYARLAYVRLRYSVYDGSLMTTYITLLP